MSAEPRTIVGTAWLSIVGIGEDGVDGLSPAARRAVERARHVFGGTRHLALAAPLIRGERTPWPSPLHGALEAMATLAGHPVAVLATGDPFHYGIGTLLAGRFGAEAIACLPQPSAFSLAAARLGWSLQETSLVSLHGRSLAGIVRWLQPGARILALSWDGATPASLAALLRERGLGGSRLTVLEAMGGPHERVRTAAADGFDIADVQALNTIALEVDAGPGTRIAGLAPGLDDGLFENDGQLTKREIRAVTLSALAPRQGELLWDIGLGAGSIAIEWLLRHPAMRAIGIEARAGRAERARRNADALGAADLDIVVGEAPDALAGLAPPDAVFVGGGLGDAGVFDTAWSALKPGGRLVANAVSLESEAILARLFERHGGDLLRLQVARADRVGSMHGWRPAMPVTQWRVTKP